MKKALAVFAVVMAGLLVAGFVTLASRSPEPAYQGKPISLWIADLGSCDYEVRDKATEAIDAIGPPAVPHLVRVLRQRETRWTKAFTGLDQKFPFLQLPVSQPAQLRERAAEQLGVLGADSETAIFALLSALVETDDAISSQVQRALRRSSPASLPHLIRALKHSDARIRQAAATVLGDLAPASRDAVPALLIALNDRDETVRSQAAHALGLMNSDEERLLLGLSAALEDKRASVRASAAEAFGHLRSKSLLSTASLLSRLSDPSAMVRVAAAKALWTLQGQAERVVPVLTEALHDPSAGWQAVFALGEIGPEARDAIPALIESLKQEKVPRPLRTPPSAALALGRIGRVAVPELVLTLRDDQARVRMAAAIALGFVGPDAKEAAPALVMLLKDRELEVRQATALSLGSIGVEATELKPVLVELVNDEDIFVSIAAASLLARIDPDAVRLPRTE